MCLGRDAAMAPAQHVWGGSTEFFLDTATPCWEDGAGEDARTRRTVRVGEEVVRRV